MIFDDYNWTYAGADNQRDATDGITHRQLSKDEQEIPQIKEVFELLVKQHPSYGNLLVLDEADWVLAQKTMSQDKQYRIIDKPKENGIMGSISRRVSRKMRQLSSR